MTFSIAILGIWISWVFLGSQDILWENLIKVIKKKLKIILDRSTYSELNSSNEVQQIFQAKEPMCLYLQLLKIAAKTSSILTPILCPFAVIVKHHHYMYNSLHYYRIRFHQNQIYLSVWGLRRFSAMNVNINSKYGHAVIYQIFIGYWDFFLWFCWNTLLQIYIFIFS